MLRTKLTPPLQTKELTPADAAAKMKAKAKAKKAMAVDAKTTIGENGTHRVKVQIGIGTSSATDGERGSFGFLFEEFNSFNSSASGAANGGGAAAAGPQAQRFGSVNVYWQQGSFCRIRRSHP